MFESTEVISDIMLMVKGNTFLYGLNFLQCGAHSCRVNGYFLLQPSATQGPLPQNAAITVASLQATSNLLQQAIAMASAQMAATNNAQLQQV